MKSQYFKNLAKGLVIVSAALALVNCDDSTAANNDAAQQEVAGLQDVTDPNNPSVDPTVNPNQPVVDPVTGEVTYPTTEPAVDPVTGEVIPTTEPSVDPVTGEVVDPAQGSVENPDQQGTDPVVDPGTDPVDTTATNPAVSSSSVGGADPDPAPASSSSEAVKPASSSSEQVIESSSSEAPKEKGVFLAEGTDETKDQMRVKYIEHTGWDGGGILAYPEQLSNDQKHAVVVWGPGGGTEPGAYGGIIRRLASHGFVVIALKESPGNATQAVPALDWLEKKNKDPNDPLYQKLDMSKVGCSGHSMGGLESEQALIKDRRVITAMLNISGDLGHTAMSQVSTSKTIGIVYGEGGMERPNAEADYNNQGVRAPACLIKMTGGQGNECQQGECGWGHGSGPWGGMAATVAWMRWHLGGEDDRKADFVGTSGKYINGPIVGERGNWKGQCKNF